MTKRMVSVLIFTIYFFIFGSVHTLASSNDDGVELFNDFISRQFNALVDGEQVDMSDIFMETESTTLYCHFLEWRITQADLLGSTYSDYRHDIKLQEVQEENNTQTFKFYGETEYMYNETPMWCGQSNIYYTISVVETQDGHKISYIDTNEIMYAEFMTNILANEKNPIKVEQKVIHAIEDLHLIAEQFDNISKTNFEVENLTDASLEEVTPHRALYTYNQSVGVAYANKYWSTNNPYFYTAGVDCTNFISQCIWASYGGWSSSDSNATMQSNINNRKRMVPGAGYSSGWYAGSGGGSQAWESVTSFWNYVTGNPSVGPKATGFNNNGVYTNILATDITAGQVLQVRNGNSGSYGHSVYVISGQVSNPSSYGSVIVAQHSSNTTRSVADLVSSWGGSSCNMRRLSFTSANFNQ